MDERPIDLPAAADAFYWQMPKKLHIDSRVFSKQATPTATAGKRGTTVRSDYLIL
jgi:hypothetical protein